MQKLPVLCAFGDVVQTNKRFDGQGKKEGRLMSVSEGVGAEVTLETFSGDTYTLSSATLSLQSVPR